MDKKTPKTPTILVVDDEKAIADLIEVYLENENFKVIKAHDAQTALAIMTQEKIDLAILDLMLPDMDGFELCQVIREKYDLPVIMLTAKDQEMDKITGLTLGADDYVTKPFKPLELMARVKAQLRRSQKYNQHNSGSTEEIVCRGLRINKQTHECFLDEKKLELTPLEFKILAMLCSKQGEVVDSEKIFEEVWGEEYFTNSNNTVMVHVRHLREKMNDTADNPNYIKTVWGIGYKIEK